MEAQWTRGNILGSCWSRVSFHAGGADSSKTSLNSVGSLKTVFEEYIAKHRLVQPDHRNILLDEQLGPAVGVKKSHPGETIPREEALKRLRAGVAWSVSIGGVVK